MDMLWSKITNLTGHKCTVKKPQEIKPVIFRLVLRTVAVEIYGKHSSQSKHCIGLTKTNSLESAN